MSTKHINVQQFEEDLKSNKNIVLIDCRTYDEFQEGHLANSLNYDFNNGDLVSALPNLEKEKQYYIYCRSGARSNAAANLMVSQGFSDVTNMLGGILAWKGEVVK